MNSRTLSIALIVVLAACTAPPPRPVRSAGGLPPPPAARAGAVNYTIDAGRSELRLLVYRAGPMARLGHNHVIVNHGIGGWVHWMPNPAGSSFAMQIPVEGFGVDDDAARSEEGAEFASPVDEDAKRGTLRNMLGPALLNGEAHPAITIRSTRIEGEEPALKAHLLVEVAGHESVLVLPLNVQRGGEGLIASAEFTLRQSLLGLAPFSVMLGALQVRDDFTVKLRILARPEGKTPAGA